MSNENKFTLQNANAAVAVGDYEKFLDYCTEDTTWTFVGERTLKGKKEVLQYMRDNYLEPPVVSVEHLVGEDDILVAEGEIILLENSGTRRKYAYCDVWEFRNGKMAQLKAYVVAVDK